MSWSKREDFGYEAFRQEILRRDKKRCQMPGCGSKKRLQVHHIQKYSNSPILRTDRQNGITLCSKCHKQIKNKEKFYIILFTNIVIENENSTRH